MWAGPELIVRSRPDEAALAAYADRVIARMEAVAPGFTDSVLHRS
jgi:hypothetical protein